MTGEDMPRHSFVAKLSAEHGRDDGVVVARIDGEIDLSNAKRIGKDLLDQVPSDAVGLVVDLSGVRYIDSSGVRMVFDVARALVAGRRHLALSVPESSPLRRLFAVTQVEAAAPVRGTVEDGRAAVLAIVAEGNV